MQESTCSICLDTFPKYFLMFKQDEKISNPFTCNHVFHSKCIKTWINNNRSCPICRNKEVKKEKPKRFVNYNYGIFSIFYNYNKRIPRHLSRWERNKFNKRKLFY